MIKLNTPIEKKDILSLKVGDTILLSGVIYTARDAAHKKMLLHLQETGEMLLKGETIYYAGPCPAKPNEAIGSVGPTTSYRMDSFTPIFIKQGIFSTIGKGKRSEEVGKSIKEFGGVHFDAIGGAGAYYKNCVKKAQLVYFPELGAEAVYRLEIVDFPCIVAIV